MSFPCFLVPNPPTQRTILKFASRLSGNSSYTFSHASRPFSTSQHLFNSSKRKLQTATAYRPQALDPTFPRAPQIAGVPDTSIATSMPKVNDIRRPPHINQQHQFQNESWSSSLMTLRKGEAQQSIPEIETSPHQILPTIQPSTLESPKVKRQSRLRPRKAAMTITPQAVKQLRRLLQQPNPKMIRVGVKNRGCSGLAYNLEYVDKPSTFDETVEQEGVKVLIDSKALFSIIGSEMNWVDDRLNQRFVFRNPNISLSLPNFMPSESFANDSYRRAVRVWGKLHGLENTSHNKQILSMTANLAIANAAE